MELAIMSNRMTTIHLASSAQVIDIERLLSVDLSNGQLDTKLCKAGKVGWISIYYDVLLLPNYKTYQKDFKWRLVLASASRWDEIRLILSINLCAWLVDEFPGDYLVDSDTGNVLYYCNNDEFVANESIKAWCQASRAITGRMKFEKLPPL